MSWWARVSRVCGWRKVVVMPDMWCVCATASNYLLEAFATSYAQPHDVCAVGRRRACLFEPQRLCAAIRLVPRRPATCVASRMPNGRGVLPVPRPGEGWLGRWFARGRAVSACCCCSTSSSSGAMSCLVAFLLHRASRRAVVPDGQGCMRYVGGRGYPLASRSPLGVHRDIVLGSLASPSSLCVVSLRPSYSRAAVWLR